MIITVATIPIPDEDPKLFWKWKFFLVDGKLATIIDREQEDYEEGFLDGVAATSNINVRVNKILIDDFPVEDHLCAGESDVQNKLIQCELDRLIPQGTPAE